MPHPVIEQAKPGAHSARRRGDIVSRLESICPEFSRLLDLAPQSLWGQPVVVGAGIAGSVAALTLAPHPSVLLDPSGAGQLPATGWAQGGLAAAVGPDDTPSLHAQDTVAAGAGLSDPDIALRIASAAPEAIAMLEEFGVRFDRAGDGNFALGLEAAHSSRRILHSRDATGAALLSALAVRIAEPPAITRLPGAALQLVTRHGGIAGVVLDMDGRPTFLPTGRIILATGGVGGLWQSTTNPRSALGTGLALAGRAGAMLADLEFMQFHPTALAVGADPMPLVSEAVRGEGARLIDQDGKHFMAGVPGGELAARDVVAREVFRRWAEGGSAALDVRNWEAGRFAHRFPNIHKALSGYRLDPARDPIPIRPAAHYHMGGIKTDANGRSSVEGLWAAGEVACTFLHGANRLASNSLLEAVVCGRWAGADASGVTAGKISSELPDFNMVQPASPDAIARMREVMETCVGVTRDAARLTDGIGQLAALAGEARGTQAAGPVALASLIAQAALKRTESRGAHFRDDAIAMAGPPAHSSSEWAELS